LMLCAAPPKENAINASTGAKVLKNIELSP
jgi:hypothetical protein